MDKGQVLHGADLLPPQFTSEKPTLTPVHSVLSDQDQAEFKSFSWTAPHVG